MDFDIDKSSLIVDSIECNILLKTEDGIVSEVFKSRYLHPHIILKISERLCGDVKLLLYV